MEKDPDIDPRAEGKYLERRRAEKAREADRARMDRIEAKLDMLLGNVKYDHGVSVYDAEGVDVTATYKVVYDFSGHRLTFKTPQTAEDIIEALKVMRLLPDSPHWLYAESLGDAPGTTFTRIPDTQYVMRSCKIQAQQVQEKIPA